MDLIRYSHCPICKNASIGFKFSAVDHSVSKKLFELWDCANCNLRFTQDAPNESSIGTYYQSENYISHTNSNKGIVNGLYHIIRRITLLQKHRLIQSITGMPTGSLLDLGAGAGTFAAFMQLSDWKVTALEPDLTAREIALKTNGISLLPSQQLFQLTENSYDAITLWHVLEHVHTLEAYIAQLKKILKPTGRLFIAVPNYTSFDAALYKEHWAAYDVPRHLYHFSPSAMRQLLKQHDLTIESIKPMWFDSFYVSILSEKYKGSKLRLLKGAWNGFISNLKALFHKEKCSSLIYIIRK